MAKLWICESYERYWICLKKPEYALILSQYAWICLNKTKYDLICRLYLKKQSNEYARILTVSDAVHSTYKPSNIYDEALYPRCAPLSVTEYASISLKMPKYRWKSSNKLFWICHDHFPRSTGFWTCLGFLISQGSEYGTFVHAESLHFNILE